MNALNYKLFEIKMCRACGSKNLKKILSLGNQYLSDFMVFSKKTEKYPLILMLCDNCSLLQLKHTAPKSSLYTERYGYRSGINKTMRNELKEIVEISLKKAKLGKKSLVVDIGANDGTLLSFYNGNYFRVGVEPIKKFTKDCKMYADIVVDDFFDYSSFLKSVGNKKALIITIISCFYDMEDPDKFVSDIKKILHKDGIVVIQQNYLGGMLKFNAFDNIVHEHLEYYSLLSLENLLKKHEFEVFDVQKNDVNGGSFRTFISHKGMRKINQNVIRLRKQEKNQKLNDSKTYKGFEKRVKKAKYDLHKFLVKLKENGKIVYVYGASTRGNTLLQYCKVNNKFVKAAVERNPEKYGKIISSVDIPIISEDQARKEKPDYMLVLPWFFKKEFLKREQNYLKRGGHFIFPLPNLEVI